MSVVGDMSGLLVPGVGIGVFWSLAVFRALASDRAPAWRIHWLEWWDAGVVFCMR
jgi:hypothetical protein